ncbi:hypothetical protein Hanom_Chr17g01546071 [Helianthus anomalus]
MYSYKHTERDKYKPDISASGCFLFCFFSQTITSSSFPPNSGKVNGNTQPVTETERRPEILVELSDSLTSALRL